MATHFLDFKSANGRTTACGRYYADDTPLPRGVAIDDSDFSCSCHPCLRTERLRLARERRHISEGDVTPVPSEKIDGCY